MKTTVYLCLSLMTLSMADKGFEQSQYRGAGSSFGEASFAPPPGFGGSFGRGSGGQGSYAGGDENGGSLEETIPGIPGDDYPIFGEVPETSFICDGQADGGYYGDPEAECQAFHICANDGNGGLSKFSFLCPNGTLFQQQYFVCDWWFNVDCSTTEDFYSLNDEIAAEREANSPDGGAAQYGAGRGGQGGQRRGSQGAASAPRGSYASPSGSYSSPNSVGSGSDYRAPGGFGGLGGYARNPRGLDLASILIPPPLPQDIPFKDNQITEDN